MIVYSGCNFSISEGMGGGLAARDELLALCATGEPVTVVSSVRDNVPSRMLGRQLSMPSWLCPDEAALPVPGFRKDYLLAQWRLCLNGEKIRRLHPSLLVVQGISQHRLLARYQEWKGSARAITLHGSPFQFGFGRGLDAEGRKRILCEMESYPFMVCPSKNVGEMWTSMPGLNHIRLFTIPNCAREDEITLTLQKPVAEVRKQLGVQEQTFLVVCPASVQHRKGQDQLIRIWPALKRIRPESRLYLIGPTHGLGSTEYLEGAEAMMTSVVAGGLQNDIVFTGMRGDILDFMYAADLIILPSREEAMPLAILEAMALGKPIIASNVCGIPEQIQDQREGLLFVPDHLDMLESVILKMAGDEDTRVRYGREAREKYWKEFSRLRQFDRWRDAHAAMTKLKRV